MCWLVVWFLGAFCCCVSSSWNLFAGEKVKLELNNSGPVYYLSEISFSARLIGALPDHEYTYEFKSYRPVDFFFSRDGNREMQVNHTFNISPEEEGTFEMKVKVQHRPFIIMRTVAEGTMKFTLSRNIPARLVLVQNGTSLKINPGPQGKTLVSSAMPVNASCVVNDPAGYFSGRGLTFKNYWELNDDQGIYNETMLFRFPSKKGIDKDSLRLFIYAKFPNDSNAANGALSQNIEALNPITTLNSTGDLYLPRGHLTQLDFSCNASPPIYYNYVPVNVPGNSTDFNCTGEHRLNKCQFSAVHYFDVVGDHEIRVCVYNEVNNFLHLQPLKMIYKIHIYDVESKGLLGLFIVPISCIIVGFVVAVAGVAFYKHTKGDMRIEVANFDFGGASNSLDFDDPVQAALFEERTFWSHLRDELAESSSAFGWLSRRPKRVTILSIVDDDLLSNEDVPDTTAGPSISTDHMSVSTSSNANGEANKPSNYR